MMQMTRERYESLPLTALKEIAKSRHLKRVTGLKKQELIDRLLVQDEVDDGAKIVEKIKEEKSGVEFDSLDSGNVQSGLLEITPEGYGFVRSNGYYSGLDDMYVSPSQIRKFHLRTGDEITGTPRIKGPAEKFGALLYLRKVNGVSVNAYRKNMYFEDLVPIFPNERIRLSVDDENLSMRITDLISPIGKGQRGMIVSPPKAGKTTLLKQIALSVKKNEPDMHIIVLLIDERPEEVTDIKETVGGEGVDIVYSTFDEQPEQHKRVSELVIERAKRLVECGKDVIILLDSITRLARAYNLTCPPSGKTLSGGLDPTALYMPKRFFGAARNIKGKGSLTILATALVDTGSRMDDVVYEEFKGTGNMELVLDRRLQERRVFPAIDIPRSGTRREDLLLTRDEQDAINIIRKGLNSMKSEEAADDLLNLFASTPDNDTLVRKINRDKMI